MYRIFQISEAPVSKPLDQAGVIRGLSYFSDGIAASRLSTDKDRDLSILSTVPGIRVEKDLEGRHLLIFYDVSATKEFFSKYPEYRNLYFFIEEKKSMGFLDWVLECCSSETTAFYVGDIMHYYD